MPRSETVFNFRSKGYLKIYFRKEFEKDADDLPELDTSVYVTCWNYNKC